MEAEEPDSTGAEALQDSSLGGVGGVSPAEGLVPPSSEAVIGRLLGEPGRFAYAALCAVSLAQLFPGLFRQQYVQALVSWLGLCDTVLPVMEAFLGGLGLEGTDTFLSVLQKEPRLQHGAQPVIQDLVSFSVRDGEHTSLHALSVRESVSSVQGEREAPSVDTSHCHSVSLPLPLILSASASDPQCLCFLHHSLSAPREEESRRRRKERGRKLKRYLLIGLATVGGGTVIGLTGGLAAPLVAAGAGAVIGAGGAAALGSVAGIAIMASLFGAAGAGLTGYKMNKRVGAIEEFEFRPLSTGKHLHLTIAVTGWLCRGKYSSFQAPWASLRQSREQYCLCWESRYLLELGSALDSLLDGLVSMVAQEALKYTVLSGILTALTWPASLLAVASVIDNPWGVCLSRSAEVGKQLAQVLRSRQQGRRPVSLIGFSLGARVIYFCLQELANDTDCEGVIEDVVLLGAPVDGSARQWKALSRVVSGRIINGYCRGDWLLSFVYRSSSAQLSVAGLQPINLDDRRMMNVDLSSVVKGHLDYMRQIETILVAVGVPTREGACLGDVLSMPQESVATEREPKPEPESDQSALGGGANEGGTEPGDEAGGVVCGAGVESVCRLGGGGGPGQEEPSVSEAERKEEDGVTTTTSPQTEGNGGRRGGLEHAGQY
nr:PREDICTED: transmembrane and coiled-coil domain-containing protein 4 [Lepisosteus oculatus]